jgi:hypothetical protein
MWLQDPELQDLTGSEPLTLEEEYEQQKSYESDENSVSHFFHADIQNSFSS